MYRRVEDFITDFEQENAATLKVLRALTDASLAQQVVPEGRTLGRLAWHIVATLHEMPGQAGLATAAEKAEAPVPARAAEIVTAYETAARTLTDAVAGAWTDAVLTEEIPLYGETWKRGAVLSGVIRHEVHHRGQMTVLMRQAGLRVPGVYGPAKEEWAAYGMAAQD
jgi:uncharacterized damage-inducible protein DinB